jgi:hypothetical protein
MPQPFLPAKNEISEPVRADAPERSRGKTADRVPRPGLHERISSDHYSGNMRRSDGPTGVPGPNAAPKDPLETAYDEQWTILRGLIPLNTPNGRSVIDINGNYSGNGHQLLGQLETFARRPSRYHLYENGAPSGNYIDLRCTRAVTSILSGNNRVMMENAPEDVQKYWLRQLSYAAASLSNAPPSLEAQLAAVEGR